MGLARRRPASLSVPLLEVAERVGGRVVGDGGASIAGFATLGDASPGDISFYDNPIYRESLARTRATAVVISEECAGETSINRVVVGGDVRGHTLKLLDMFYPLDEDRSTGCHETAHVSPDAQISPGASVRALASVGAGSSVADGAFVGEGCRVGRGVRIARDVVLHPNVTLCDYTEIGARSVVHSGSVIGADGFGYVRVGDAPSKLPQVGRAVIGEDVEIGALTAVDRGALGDTVVGDRVKIDNLVQVGHNVRIGDDTLICGKVGISGSVTIGRRVTIGGNCGINGHISIADDVTVMGGSNVVRAIEEAGTEHAGVIPAMPSRQWWRSVARFLARKKAGAAGPEAAA